MCKNPFFPPGLLRNGRCIVGNSNSADNKVLGKIFWQTDPKGLHGHHGSSCTRANARDPCPSSTKPSRTHSLVYGHANLSPGYVKQFIQFSARAQLQTALWSMSPWS